MESERMVEEKDRCSQDELAGHVTFCGIGFEVANDRAGALLNRYTHAPDHCAGVLATVEAGGMAFNSSNDVCTLFR